MSAYYFYYKNNLYHHGVKGMHWGRLNGPPYPIGSGPKKPMKEREAAARKRKKEQALASKARKTADMTMMNTPGFMRDPVIDIIRQIRSVRKLNEGVIDYRKLDGPYEKVSKLKKKKDNEENIMDDMAKCNPRKEKNEPGTTNNCGNCTIAMEMRSRGYDVRARKTNYGVTEEDIDRCFPGSKNQAYKPKIKSLPNEDRKKYTTRAYNMICKDIEKWGDGSRGYIGAMYDKLDGGHVMFWKVSNGKVNFYDGQANKKNYTNFFHLVDPTTYEYSRLDNLSVTDDVGKMVVSVDKKKRK